MGHIQEFQPGERGRVPVKASNDFLNLTNYCLILTKLLLFYNVEYMFKTVSFSQYYSLIKPTPFTKSDIEYEYLFILV